MLKQDWQPIETAPKDGTSVLILEKNRQVYQVKWRYSTWEICWHSTHGCGCCGDGNVEPTHWMPLPSPPKEAE